jgi:(2Fe-2S) ferredoxin
MAAAVPTRPTVFVCRGSSCRRHKACGDLRDCLGPVADLADVRCQRVCDGPVVGTHVNGSLEWFKRMDSDKAQRHLVELVAGERPLRKSLEKRRVPKRAGSLR